MELTNKIQEMINYVKVAQAIAPMDQIMPIPKDAIDPCRLLKLDCGKFAEIGIIVNMDKDVQVQIINENVSRDDGAFVIMEDFEVIKLIETLIKALACNGDNFKT